MSFPSQKMPNHSHHHSQEQNDAEAPCPSCQVKRRFDWLLWGSLTIVALGYGASFFGESLVALSPLLETFADATASLLNKMWWGLLLGLLFVGFLAKIPQEFVMAVLGKPGTKTGIFRAATSGVLLDLCSHGILVVGMQLYKRGASLGQVMAFLIASPWNSLSLTLILWALVGFQWMITFLLLSLVMAILSGFFFDRLVKQKVLPPNPNARELPENFHFWAEARAAWRQFSFSKGFGADLLHTAWRESRMILRWIFLGIVLAGLLRTFLSPEAFQTVFGPTMAGLGLTVLVATILEVCSEGSTPIAADILTRAKAPGNAFGFLMAGVSTDYTEIAALKETTKRWKIALFLPLVTLPQIILIAWILNQVSLT